MFFCKLGKFKKKSAFPFLLTYFLVIEFASIKDINNVDTLNQIFFMSIFHSISSFFCGIFEVIIRCRQKTSNNIQSNFPQNNNINILLLQSKKEKGKLIKLILLYILIIILDSIVCVFFIYREVLLGAKSNPTYIQNGMKGVLIFSSSVFCYFILKYRLEKYKKIGLLIIFLSLTLNGIISYFEGAPISILVLVLEFCINFLTGFQEVIEKYLIHFMFQSPYKILFYEGAFGIVLLFFCLLFNTFVFHSKDGLTLSWLWDSSQSLLLYCFSCGGYNLFRILINRDFSPTHRVISDSFYSFVIHITKMFGYKQLVIQISYFFGYLFVVIGSLIYNEMIIITCCGIDSDTGNKISIRGIDEYKLVTFDLGILNEEDETQVQSLNNPIAE